MNVVKKRANSSLVGYEGGGMGIRAGPILTIKKCRLNYTFVLLIILANEKMLII